MIHDIIVPAIEQNGFIKKNEFLPIFYLPWDLCDTELHQTGLEFIQGGVLRPPSEKSLLIFKIGDLHTGIFLKDLGEELEMRVYYSNPMSLNSFPSVVTLSYETLKRTYARTLEVQLMEETQAIKFFNSIITKTVAGLMLLNTKDRHLTKQTIGVSDSQNAKRIRKGRDPIRSWTEISLTNIEYEGVTPTGKQHKSPKAHWRRGHIRKLNTGKLTKVSPCLVGISFEGDSNKIYKVKELQDASI